MQFCKLFGNTIRAKLEDLAICTQQFHNIELPYRAYRLTLSSVSAVWCSLKTRQLKPEYKMQNNWIAKQLQNISPEEDAPRMTTNTHRSVQTFMKVTEIKLTARTALNPSDSFTRLAATRLPCITLSLDIVSEYYNTSHPENVSEKPRVLFVQLCNSTTSFRCLPPSYSRKSRDITYTKG